MITTVEKIHAGICSKSWPPAPQSPRNGHCASSLVLVMERAIRMFDNPSLLQLHQLIGYLVALLVSLICSFERQRRDGGLFTPLCAGGHKNRPAWTQKHHSPTAPEERSISCEHHARTINFDFTTFFRKVFTFVQQQCRFLPDLLDPSARIPCALEGPSMEALHAMCLLPNRAPGNPSPSTHCSPNQTPSQGTRRGTARL